MFGFNKLFGLDIGNGAVKSCEISASGKNAKINKFNLIKTSEAAYKNGEILSPAGLSTLIKAATEKIRNKKTAIGVSGSSVMVKRITIPKMDVDLLPEQVRWEAEQYIPYNIDEVNIDYIVLNSQASSDTMDLLLVAAQQNRISQFVDAVADVKLKPELVDVSSFALANCFMFNYPEAKKSTVGLIDVGAFFTHFVILSKGEVVFCRDIPSGGQIFDEELSKNLGIPEDEARQMRESEGVLPDIAMDTINSVAKRYSEQIVGALEFFTETTQGMKVEEVFVTGGASLTVGLLDSLSVALQVPVSYMNVLKNITATGGVLKANSEKNLQYRSAVAIGLALRKAGDS